MNVTALASTGNSSKFHVITKRGEFNIAFSYTLRLKIWELKDLDAELTAAKELAEAIVSRHNTRLPFKPLYIFAEHNSEPVFNKAVERIRKYGVED